MTHKTLKIQETLQFHHILLYKTHIFTKRTRLEQFFNQNPRMEEKININESNIKKIKTSP